MYSQMPTFDLLTEVLEKPRSAFIPFPGMRHIARPDWHQLTTPAMKGGGLNSVSLAIISSDKADQVIDDTIRGYDELGLHFRWSVGPDSRPLDLGKRLEARGLNAVSVAGMAATQCSVSRATDVEVDLVGPDALQEFNDVMSEGWGITSSALCDYNAHVLRESPGQNPFFIARIDGKGVGVASYFAFPNSAFLVGGVVLQEFRKRGVYRALVAARQEHALKMGRALTTCHAIANSSAPILSRLGFETVCPLTFYVK